MLRVNRGSKALLRLTGLWREHVTGVAERSCQLLRSLGAGAADAGLGQVWTWMSSDVLPGGCLDIGSSAGSLGVQANLVRRAGSGCRRAGLSTRSCVDLGLEFAGHHGGVGRGGLGRPWSASGWLRGGFRVQRGGL